MVFFLLLREVERNGERDERRGFERHGVGDNGALAVRVEHARGAMRCAAICRSVRARFAILARDAGIASFNVSHAPRDRFLVSYTFL